MRTIRRNVFETNSSSVHCVTILSDKEYNNIKNGKAVIDYQDYIEITPQFIQEKIAEDNKYSNANIEDYKQKLEKCEKLVDVDTGDWTEEDKRTIAGWEWKRLSGSELKIKLREFLEQTKERIQYQKNSITETEAIDPKKMTKLLEKMIPDLDRLKEHEYDEDDDEDEDYNVLSAKSYDCTEEEFNWAVSFLRDKDNIDTYGSGYDESDYNTRTIDGVTVHVLSYSGYNG